MMNRPISKHYQLLCLLFFSLAVQAQQNLWSVNLERHRLEHEGMMALTTWASANIAGGTMGYFLAKEPEWKYFHEMNVFWNTVNMGLGVAALATLPRKKPNEQWTLEQSRKAQRKIENVFLINTGIDLLYVGGGAAMRLLSNHPSKQSDRLRGYGHALLLQGGFLFFFDGMEYLLHRNNGWRLFDKNIHLSMTSNGIGLRVRF